MIKFTDRKFKSFNKHVGQLLQGAIFATVGLCLTSALVVGIAIPFSEVWWEVLLSVGIIIGCFSLGFWLLDWFGKNYWRLQLHKPIITVKYDMVINDMVVLSSDDADRCVEVIALIDDGIDEWDCSDDILYINDTAENDSKLD
jgi:hypothetical protein